MAWRFVWFFFQFLICFVLQYCFRLDFRFGILLRWLIFFCFFFLFLVFTSNIELSILFAALLFSFPIFKSIVKWWSFAHMMSKYISKLNLNKIHKYLFFHSVLIWNTLLVLRGLNKNKILRYTFFFFLCFAILRVVVVALLIERCGSIRCLATIPSMWKVLSRAVPHKRLAFLRVTWYWR